MSSAVTWMDLQIVNLNEIRQRKANIICRICKNDTNEPIYKTELVTDVENKHYYQQGKGERGKLGD